MIFSEFLSGSNFLFNNILVLVLTTTYFLHGFIAFIEGSHQFSFILVYLQQNRLYLKINDVLEFKISLKHKTKKCTTP
jgi:hypothetical protein